MDVSAAPPPLDPQYPCFDERFYNPNLTPRELAPPELDQVSNFIGACIKRGSFSCEVLVISLVLFNRLVCFSTHPMKPHAYTWKLMFLTSILVSQKIWDVRLFYLFAFVDI